MLKFDLPKNQSSIIKVIGVGGGGSNAVTHMYKQGIRGVDFILANTDSQALGMSEVPEKMQLGVSLTEGLGAGSIPEVGKKAALESAEEIKKILEGSTKMAFITAGMGGGTGTGAAPVIASISKELGILTVGIVTIPFGFEGRKRRQQADAGIEELRKYVDTLLIICNDKLREVHGDLKLSEAFNRADDILTIAAKGIAEIITVTGYINVDFNDVNTVMRNSGVAIMGTGVAEGEDRALRAVEMALNSPLLNDNNIHGAKNILLYIASGEEEVSMDEVIQITDYIQTEAGSTAEIIWGNGTDNSIGKHISVTLVATGFNAVVEASKIITDLETEKIILSLDEEPEKPKDDNKKKEDFQVYNKEEKQETPKKVTEYRFEDANTDVELKPVNTVQDDGQDFELKTRPQPETDQKDQTSNTINVTQVSSQPDVTNNQPVKTAPGSGQEMVEKGKERTHRLRAMSLDLRTSNNLEKIENEPAYIRRNVELEDIKPADESNVPRMVMGEDEDKNPALKNNSFLHENPD